MLGIPVLTQEPPVILPGYRAESHTGTDGVLPHTAHGLSSVSRNMTNPYLRPFPPLEPLNLVAVASAPTTWRRLALLVNGKFTKKKRYFCWRFNSDLGHSANKWFILKPSFVYLFQLLLLNGLFRPTSLWLALSYPQVCISYPQRKLRCKFMRHLCITRHNPKIKFRYVKDVQSQFKRTLLGG